MVIGDQMKQRPFHEIAKSASFGIGPVKIAVEQLESKLLEDFVGGVWIAQYFAQIALDRAPVALKQLLAGGIGRLGRTLMRSPDQRPQGRDQAEPVIEVFELHGNCSGRLRTGTLGPRNSPDRNYVC